MRNNRLLKSFASITVIAAVIALAVTCVPVQAETEDAALAEAVEEIGRQLQENADEDAFAFRNEVRRKTKSTSLLRSSSSLPAAYSLRDPNGDGNEDDGYVTSVKLQSPFGTCWGFAAIASAEASIISSSLAGRDLDLSEKQIAFFVYRHILDTDNSQYGEGMNFLPGDAGHSSDIFAGGFSAFATGLYASGTGPVKESDNTQYVYRGKNGNHDDCNYLADDDWWIDDDLRFNQDFVLKESRILPQSATYLKKGDMTNFTAAVNAMKSEIMAGRPLHISYMSPNALPNQPLSNDYINTETWAHYTYKWDLDGDHAVTIVGWDDNYPKENFVHQYNGSNTPAPTNNGAWLVKNSWGSGEEDFPNNGGGDWGLFTGQERGVYNESTEEWEYNKTDDVHTGYFWLSYEDHSINKPESVVFGQVSGEPEYIAQYDYMPVTDVNAVFYDFVIKMANVFTVGDHTGGKSAYVTDVSCQTVTPGTRVTYEIYKLADNSTNPTDGEKLATKENTYEFGGYHRETLDAPLHLGSNDRFSIVVTQKTPDNKYAFSSQTTSRYQDEYKENKGTYKFECKGIVNEGESLFYTPNGIWADLNTSRNKLLGSNSSSTSLDNFPIKAFMTEAADDPDPQTDIVLPKPKMGLVYNKTDQALVKEGSVPDGASVTYSVDGVNYSADIPVATNADSYRIYYKIEQAGEAPITGDFTTTIGKKTLEVEWSDERSFEYDGQLHYPGFSWDYIEGDVVNAVIYGCDLPDAGSYTAQITALEGTDAGNYALPQSGLACDYTITKRPVTITSSDVNSVYTGSAVTGGSVTCTSGSFVDGQGFTENITGARTAPGESPNTFEYTLDDGTNAGNYDITVVYGKITVGWWDNVDDHVITVTAKDATSVYNGETQTVTPGLVDGCTSGTFDGVEFTVSGLSSSGSGKNVGSYTIDVTGTEEVSYETDKDATGHIHVEKVPGTFTITARA